jgi:hypothetical protein
MLSHDFEEANCVKVKKNILKLRNTKILIRTKFDGKF